MGIACVVIKVWQDFSGNVVLFNPRKYPFLYIKGQAIEGEDSLNDCVDSLEDSLCNDLASQPDACEKTPYWMVKYCPMTCGYCHFRSSRVRCDEIARDSMDKQVYSKDGDIDRMFKRIERNYAHLGITVLSRDPWLVTLDEFTTEEEAEELISLTKHGMHRSLGQAAGCHGQSMDALECKAGEGIETIDRTSMNSWCIDEECVNSAFVGQITNKIEEMTEVPSQNFEHYQVLRYNPSEQYLMHHDLHSSRDNRRVAGPRIFTFFLYLSDVEEGGETVFSYLNATIKPRKGKAVLWSNVYSHDPTIGDPRTVHAALPVINGTKYAANAWIHSREYKKASNWGCADYQYQYQHQFRYHLKTSGADGNGNGDVSVSSSNDSVDHLIEALKQYFWGEVNEALWNFRIGIMCEKYSFSTLLKKTGLYRYFF